MEQYEKNLHFTFRFRGAPVGSNRPTIYAMDWSSRPEEQQYLIAYCTDKRTFVFGFKGEWENLLIKTPSRERKPTCVKWNPETGPVLAIGCGCAPDGSSGTITLLRLDSRDQCFTKVHKLTAPEGGGVSSLSWDSTGAYLLGTTDPNELQPRGYMIVIKHITDSRRTVKTTHCGYRTPFTATFHPTRSYVLSTSRNSNEIAVWSEDTGSSRASFEWTKLFVVSCSRGITKICFSLDGRYLAAIIEEKERRNEGGKVKIYSYIDEEDGVVCCPVLKGVDIEEEDGVKKRKKGVTLQYHCQHIISCDWSRDGELITGSSSGSICIHGNNNSAQIEAQNDWISPFNVIYFRFSDVHSVHTSGSVNCVAWNPMLHTMFASGGVDGVVLVWKLLDKSIPLNDIRSYALEKNYFAPQRRSISAESEANMRDIKSASSISASESEEDDSGFSFGQHHAGASGRDVLVDRSTANSPKGLSDIEKILLEVEGKVDTNAGALRELFSALQRATTKLVVMKDGMLDVESFGDTMGPIRTALEGLPASIAEDLEEKLNEKYPDFVQLKSSLEQMEGKIMSNLQDLVATISTKQNLLEQNLRRRDEGLQTVLTEKLTVQEASIIEKQKTVSENLLSKLDCIEQNLRRRDDELQIAWTKKLAEQEASMMTKQNTVSENQLSKLDEMEQNFRRRDDQLQAVLTKKLAEQEASMKKQQNTLSENLLTKLDELEQMQLLRHQQMDTKVDEKLGKILEAVKGLIK